MDKKDLLTSFKEIKSVLSSAYNEKLYLNKKRFNEFGITEFCRLLFYVADELNTEINELKKQNISLKNELERIDKKIKN